MDPFNPPKFIECHVDNQLDVHEHVRKMRAFIFRGHRDASWQLECSFAREYNKYPSAQMIEGAEKYAIDFFRKRAHLYDIGLSKDSNLGDILSLMQHHGCPTRLVDFTRSFYIATYFAVNDSSNKNEEYAIWALNLPQIKSRVNHIYPSFFPSVFSPEFHNNQEAHLRDIIYELLQYKPLSVMEIEPQTISRRMSSQQGVLLAQINLNSTFMINLCQMLEIDQTPERISLTNIAAINQNIINDVFIVKFVFKASNIQRVRRELLNLNITSETIFPDLSGLAKSSVEHIFWQY